MKNLMKHLTKQNLIGVAPLLIALAASSAAIASAPGCGVNAGKIVQTVLDVGDAVCQTLVANDLAADQVQIECKYINAADGVAHIFIAKVPTEQASRMGIVTPRVMALRGAALPPCAAAAEASASASAAPTSAAPTAKASGPSPKASTSGK